MLGVSRQVIGLTPTGLRESVIGRVGTADKPLLIGAVVGGVLLLGPLAGLVARASLRRGLLVTVLVTASGAPGAVGTAGADPGLTLLILSAAAAAAGVVLVYCCCPGDAPDPARRSGCRDAPSCCAAVASSPLGLLWPPSARARGALGPGTWPS